MLDRIILCQAFERFKNVLVSRSVLQMNQISRLRVIASMNY